MPSGLGFTAMVFHNVYVVRFFVEGAIWQIGIMGILVDGLKKGCCDYHLFFALEVAVYAVLLNYCELYFHITNAV